MVGSMSVPGGSRPPGSTNGAGLPGATGGPVAPGHGGGTGSFDVTEALAAGPLGGNGTRPGGQGAAERGRDDQPFSPENGRGEQSTPGAPGGPNGQNRPSVFGGAQAPAGPTTGPVTGDGPPVPPLAGPGAPARPG
ncbi:hypothetical protein GTW67_36130, partial [Streptomyces sp. SID5910]|nr:hypothetical protein [Streptomyces sp. SID5910]